LVPVVAAVKLLATLAAILSLTPLLLLAAAAGMGALMLGAFVMHLKVKDPLSKALPAIAVLAVCAAIALL
jgi:hypothetical protein